MDSPMVLALSTLTDPSPIIPDDRLWSSVLLYANGFSLTDNPTGTEGL